MSESRIPAPNNQYKPLPILDENLPIRAVYGVLRVDGPLLPIPQPASAPKPKADPDTYDPIQYTIDSLQSFGFTHPNNGRYLMMPQEFRAILARETKAVATVIWEIMQQTIGWEDGPGRRREWAVLTFRHFVRARILSKSQAQLGIKQALEKHYIERRQVGARRYEYRIRWKGTN
jgi:hypothetical protein